MKAQEAAVLEHRVLLQGNLASVVLQHRIDGELLRMIVGNAGFLHELGVCEWDREALKRAVKRR